MFSPVSFQQHIRKIPQVNVDYWSFALVGKVRQPLILSFEDVRALPATRVRSALTCSAMRGKRPLMSEAEWVGVPIADLLARLTIDPLARYARIHAADQYSAILPLAALAQTYLVYEMNGAALPPEHGFPARLVAPGLQGYKMPKWINRIELSESGEGGFWEARGWSLDGTISTPTASLNSTQAEDGSLELSGVAYAGSNAIRSVQISIDGAGHMPIPFTAAEPFTLTHWQTRWTPPGAGDYEVQAWVFADGQATPAEASHLVRIR